MDMFAGEKIEVAMDGFSLNVDLATFGVDVTSNPPGTVQQLQVVNLDTASLSECLQSRQLDSVPKGEASTQGCNASVLLVFQLAADVPASSSVEFIIPLNTELVMPSRDSLTTLSISTAAPSGPVPDERFGSFLSSPRLEFSRPQAGEGARFNFTFRYTKPILRNESVVLVLPEFSQRVEASSSWVQFATFLDLEDANPVPRIVPCRVSWAEAEDEIRFSFERPIPSHSIIAIEVVSDVSGLELPERGIHDETRSGIFVYMETLYGIPVPTCVRDVAMVGALYGPSIDFTSPIAGTISELVFNFTAAMRLVPGDTLSLSLPGWIVEDPDCIRVHSDPLAAVVQAEWDEASDVLTFRIERSFPELQAFHLRVPAVHGLRIPLEGLGKSEDPADSAIKVTVEAKDGPIKDLGVAISRGIGRFVSSTLEYTVWFNNESYLIDASTQENVFDTMESVNITKVSISFAASMDLQMDDQIVVVLPGFVATVVAAPVLPGPPRPVSPAVAQMTAQVSVGDSTAPQSRVFSSWNALKSQAIFSLPVDVAAGQMVQADLSFPNYLRSPSWGLGASELSLTLAANAAVGHVIGDQPIESSPRIGQFENRPLLSINHNGTISIDFEVPFSMGQTSTISLVLEGFSVPSVEEMTLTVNSAGWQGSWNQSTSLLSMSPTSDVPEGTSLSLTFSGVFAPARDLFAVDFSLLFYLQDGTSTRAICR
eukprot:3497263-Rhodomonas_salina.1